MSFGYPAPLGSTILLKGADEEQLIKIKQVSPGELMLHNPNDTGADTQAGGQA
jgi:hypothetical protein